MIPRYRIWRRSRIEWLQSGYVCDNEGKLFQSEKREDVEFWFNLFRRLSDKQLSYVLIEDRVYV